MIREVEGDILLSDAQVIAHGIATADPFDSGLALALRERFPSMVKDYRHATHAKQPDTGDIWAWGGVNEDGSVRGIVNLCTQGMQSQAKSARPVKAKLEDVNRTLRELATWAFRCWSTRCIARARRPTRSWPDAPRRAEAAMSKAPL